LKIAFDGTVLHGRKSGVGYYCEELLKAMLAMNHEDQFFVFSHQPVELDQASANGNLKFTNSIRFPIRAVYLHAFLPQILAKVQPDVCHYTNFLAPIFEKRPYVVTIHDMGLETLRDAHPLAKRLYTKRLVPHVARKAKLIITNSEYSKWEIVRCLGIPEDRIRVTPLAASPEFRPVNADPPRPYFLYVGNLEPRKNLERLIDAFARMPSKNHDLVIAGNRWYHGGAAEEKARSLGLNGRVRFLGYVPRADLPGLFGGATALVYPSLLEGFGLPIVEAMACGTPVITSNNSSMKEVAGGAAVLIEPTSVREMTEALTKVAEDATLRQELSAKGLKRATEFSWARTAELTLDVYREAVEMGRDFSPPLRGGVAARSRKRCEATLFRADGVVFGTANHVATPSTTPSASVSERDHFLDAAASPPQRGGEVSAAITRTIEYANLFQYPLTPDELRERLFDVEIDEFTFRRALSAMQIQRDEELLRLRREREHISDEAIREMQPHLRTLASLPFVRLVSFSGSTAHRNMTTTEDVDLFLVVEDGKLWAVFLIAMVWAKLKGLRKRLCMNYLISDAALALSEHDVFTAQQAASLKPIFGKTVYDRFIEMNPFIRRCFPNFDPSRHRNRYPEIQPRFYKRILEAMLRPGPIQILERTSRLVLGRYLTGKVSGESDVQLDPRRLKLHLNSHKNRVLNAGSCALAPSAKQSHDQDVEVQAD
jgi:glycosyltransferase involved in cell wall biosynthesis